MRKSGLPIVVFLLSLLIIAGCGRASLPVEEEGEAGMALQVSSPVFMEGGTIARKNTCDA
jgi:hypothetical protein